MNNGEMLDLTDLCWMCGATGVPLEWHEPAGRANSMLPRVRVCRPCHREFSRRLLDLGLDLAHGGTRTRNDSAWAVGAGFFGHVGALFAQHRMPFVRAMAETFERMGRAATAIVEETTDGVRHPGPDPVANDRRATYRRHPKQGAGRESRDQVDLDMIERAQAVAMCSVLPQFERALFGEPRGGVQSPTQVLADNATQVAEGVEALCETGDGEDLLNRLLPRVAGIDEAARRLLRAQSPEEVDAALIEARDLITQGDEVLAFLTGLIE